MNERRFKERAAPGSRCWLIVISRRFTRGSEDSTPGSIPKEAPLRNKAWVESSEPGAVESSESGGEPAESLSFLPLTEVGYQIGDVLMFEVFFQAIRHRGFPRTRQFLQVGPQDDLSLTVGTDKRKAAAALLEEDAREHAALLGDGGVIDVPSFDGPAGVQ